MKILKFFGIVVGIHVLLLVLILSNPGCSSTSKPAPAPSDTVVQPAPAPQITVPMGSSPGGGYYTSGAPYTPAESAPVPVTFNPDAPAVAASPASDGRYRPTRPTSEVAETLVREPVADVIPTTTYTVKSGDSLWTIARRNKLTVAELRAANNLSADAVLRPGQKLLVPAKSSAANKPAAKSSASVAPKSTPAVSRPAAADGMKHIVQSGETLGEIARRYGVKSSDIAVANNISDPGKIRAGAELIIPGWQTPGGKSGRSSTPQPAAGQSTQRDQAPAAATTEPQAQPETQTPDEPPPVPVIRIDESPISPAPRP